MDSNLGVNNISTHFPVGPAYLLDSWDTSVQVPRRSCPERGTTEERREIKIFDRQRFYKKENVNPEKRKG